MQFSSSARPPPMLIRFYRPRPATAERCHGRDFYFLHFARFYGKMEFANCARLRFSIIIAVDAERHTRYVGIDVTVAATQDDLFIDENA